MITSIHIENFRSLKAIDVTLKTMAVLIGENDVGKTSVLNALQTFFNNKKLADQFDFHQSNTDEVVVIELAIQVNGDSSIIRREFEYNKPPVTKLRNGDGDYEEIKKSAYSELIFEGLFHFFPVHRDISVQFAMSKSALLGKLVRDRVRAQLTEPKAKTSLEELIEHTKTAIDEPRGKLEKYLQEQMHNSSMKLEFSDLKVDPVDGVSFVPGLSDDKVGFIPLQNRGAGTQNNLIIALLRYLAENDGAESLIIALEEPENSLHPKAQRQLLAILMELSKKHQVIITTHSPVFIERTLYESNIIITRKSDGQSVAKVFSDDSIDDLRSELGIKPSDALLKGGGNCALIVEGYTEEECMPDCFEMMGYSEFELGISIINAQGSDFERMRRICALLKSYDIPAVILLDDDASNTRDDLLRAKETNLTNLEEVFVLERGKIEDYFPKWIVIELLNTEFDADPPVSEEDLPATLNGKDLASQINRLLYERKCGKGLPYFKRVLGMKGMKMLHDKGEQLDEELQAVIESVRDVATRT